jgi:hypothetical protein
MPDEELIQRVNKAARELADASPDGEVTGEQLAEKLGMKPDDVALYHALKVAASRGDLQCEAWEGGMGLPGIIRI